MKLLHLLLVLIAFGFVVAEVVDYRSGYALANAIVFFLITVGAVVASRMMLIRDNF